MSALQTEIEQLLAPGEPQVEVLLAEVIGGSTLRVFIDHPDGRDARAVRARHRSRWRHCASAMRWRSPLRASSAR